MPEISASQWDAFVARHPEAHLLQTRPWGEFKAEFGWQVSRLVNKQAGAQILFRQLPVGFSLAYIPKGPLGTNLEALWPEIDQHCRQKRSVFLKVEPDGWRISEGVVASDPISGMLPSPHAIQPLRTLLVDLTGEEDQLLARMKQKTRYNIRLARRKGVKVEPTADLETLHKLMLITGLRDKFAVHSLDYYRRAYELFRPHRMCEVFLATYNAEPLAGLMVFAHGPRAWYLYGASSGAHRNLMPNYLLQWEAMRWARSCGCQVYDLWGVPDEDEPVLEAEFSNRSDGLWGVYRFKRGFGGRLQRAPGAWDRVYIPVLYRIYRWWFDRPHA